ncbi:MAG: TldD/PmbA family protein [Promethearchaeota archaeon]
MAEKSYDEIFSIFREITNSYNRKDQYFDILYDATSSMMISKSLTSEDISVNALKSGIVARTFDGHWREIAIDDFSKINMITEKIPKVKNRGDLLKEYEGWKLNKEIKTKIDLKNIPIEEKLEKVREIYDFTKNLDDRIINVQIRYMEINLERIFFNNEGCELRQVIPRVRIFIVPIAKEGAVVDYDYYSKSGEMGFEIFDEITTDKLEEVVQKSLEMLKAKSPPSGKYPIILDPSMSGLIAHESFGHGLEADQVLRDRSYLKNYLNKKVASEICTIYDTPAYENAFSFYFFDDEGIKSGKNLLVDKGILKNFLYDRRTASELNSIPQGNGRRESFAHPVNVRMSNTYFGSGDYTLEELISEIKYGVILIHGYFGMEDPLGGGMQCTSKKGYLIENGEKTQILKATALSGAVLELLQNIDGVSKDATKLDAGICGKGSEDYVPVTSGGSFIRVKSALISQG